MTINLQWQTGTPAGNPRDVDLYFVAIEFSPLYGEYGLATWDGEKWDYSGQGTIIGFIRFTDFKSKLDLNWPKEPPLIPDELSGYPRIDLAQDDWEEVVCSSEELKQLEAKTNTRHDSDQ